MPKSALIRYVQDIGQGLGVKILYEGKRVQSGGRMYRSKKLNPLLKTSTIHVMLSQGLGRTSLR